MKKLLALLLLFGIVGCGQDFKKENLNNDENTISLKCINTIPDFAPSLQNTYEEARVSLNTVYDTFDIFLSHNDAHSLYKDNKWTGSSEQFAGHKPNIGVIETEVIKLENLITNPNPISIRAAGSLYETSEFFKGGEFMQCVDYGLRNIGTCALRFDTEYSLAKYENFQWKLNRETLKLKLEKSRSQYIEKHWKEYQCELSDVTTLEDEIDSYITEVTKFELELKQKEQKEKQDKDTEQIKKNVI